MSFLSLREPAGPAVRQHLPHSCLHVTRGRGSPMQPLSLKSNTRHRELAKVGQVRLARHAEFRNGLRPPLGNTRQILLSHTMGFIPLHLTMALEESSTRVSCLHKQTSFVPPLVGVRSSYPGLRGSHFGFRTDIGLY